MIQSVQDMINKMSSMLEKSTNILFLTPLTATIISTTNSLDTSNYQGYAPHGNTMYHINHIIVYPPQTLHNPIHLSTCPTQPL